MTKTVPFSRQRLLLLWVLVPIVSGGSATIAGAAKPKGIPIGIFRAHPQVTVTGQWEDNLYKTEINAADDQLLRIDPVISLVTHWKKHAFFFSYGAEIQRYRIHTLEDHTNQKVTLELDLNPSRAVAVAFDYTFSAEHDARGTPGTPFLGSAAGPNRWHQHLFLTSMQYTHSRMRGKLAFTHTDREAMNNGLSSQNRFWDDLALTYYYAIAPKTALLMEAGWTAYSYDSTPALDSDERRLLGGLTWDATGKTTGEFKLGYLGKFLEIPRVPPARNPDSQILSVDSTIKWHPIKQTQLIVNGSRKFSEGEAGEDNFISSALSLLINHSFPSRWVWNTNLGINNSDYNVERRENIWSAGTGLQYAFPRWFTLGGRYNRDAKRSSVAGADYDSNLFKMYLTGAL